MYPHVSPHASSPGLLISLLFLFSSLTSSEAIPRCSGLCVHSNHFFCSNGMTSYTTRAPLSEGLSLCPVSRGCPCVGVLGPRGQAASVIEEGGMDEQAPATDDSQPSPPWSRRRPKPSQSFLISRHERGLAHFLNVGSKPFKKTHACLVRVGQRVSPGSLFS